MKITEFDIVNGDDDLWFECEENIIYIFDTLFIDIEYNIQLI